MAKIKSTYCDLRMFSRCNTTLEHPHSLPKQSAGFTSSVRIWFIEPCWWSICVGSCSVPALPKVSHTKGHYVLSQIAANPTQLIVVKILKYVANDL
eukprot:scaffold157907_cov29-Prasinocladus_malaysianus.AAC.1